MGGAAAYKPQGYALWMNYEEQDAAIPNDSLCASIGKLYSMEVGDVSGAQIPYIIRRANLSMPVVLGALYLAIAAREMAGSYVGRLTAEMEAHVFRREVLQKRIDSCLKLCSNGSLLFSIALILSSKYLVDRSYVNKTWANILMMDKFSVNEHERTMLHIFDHRIDITERALLRVLSRVKMNAEELAPRQRKEGKVQRLVRKIITCLFGKEKK